MLHPFTSVVPVRSVLLGVLLLGSLPAQTRQDPAAEDAAAKLPPPALARHVERLLSRDAAVRIDAVFEVQRSGDLRAREYLLPLVRDPELGVRRLTVEALRKFRHPSTVQALLGALADIEPVVADTAWRSLMEVSGERFPFEANAPSVDRGKARARWNEWWKQNKAEFATKVIEAPEAAKPAPAAHPAPEAAAGAKDADRVGTPKTERSRSEEESATWPKLVIGIRGGEHLLTVRNSFPCRVKVGFRARSCYSGEGFDLELAPGSEKEVRTPGGAYYVFLVRHDEPDAIYRSDEFRWKSPKATLDLGVSQGNFGMQRIR